MKERVLITGASSYVGARIYYDLREKYETVGTYHRTQLSSSFLHLDTTRQDEVKKLVEEIRPNTIIHVAANASAKWCDEHPEEARFLNETATISIVEGALRVDSSIIFISSYAALDTSNVYGQTKEASEEAIKEATNKYVILRPSLIIGLSPNTFNDRPFNRILRNIDEGAPAIYDTSWKFQPSYLGHISEVITMVIDRGIQTETIPIAVAALKSRFDIANDILSAFDIPVKSENKHDKSPVLENDLSKLKELGLPIYQYDAVIRSCVEEIKNRDKFKL